jgi:hypothetical protein
MNRIKHQLFIHVDFSPSPGGLEIRYSYPLSSPHSLGEQVIRIERDKIDVEIFEKIEEIINALHSRIPNPTPARLPHAEIPPTIRDAVTTIVIQDQNSGRTPLARLCYLEEISEIKSSIERQVKMEPKDFHQNVKKAWDRLREKIKSIVWEDYKRLAGAHLFPE